jgi:hypothetical protein
MTAIAHIVMTNPKSLLRSVTKPPNAVSIRAVALRGGPYID